MTRTNEYGQPIGDAVPGWTPRQRPPATPMQGRYCRIEPLDPARHAADLYQAYGQAPDGRLWTYLSNEPFPDRAAFDAHMEKAAASADPMHHAIVDLASGKAIGTAALMRIDPVNGVIEVGHVAYSPLLQRTPHATETQYLFMKRVFEELGYRRFEWKCDSLNEPSRKAAIRYGFTFEGIFRQAIVYKGRTRDTAWFSIIDSEWPALRAGYQAWLAPDNFDAQGRQRRTLAACMGRE
ncbi:GNAT family N-acetyltransferase [Bordetella bronchialis]|uniref:Acetyltransferase n=1 Tax=Bordetella bronchialis TaxID=463025 RepID=A0A193FHR5_9BORD|nr:GNAT family protein [Bordetella bronchialis]ANN66659.1 acetyltransferase [Bordetella bronchialis]ANN71738.1 acetyltransferase [Bordetella bronchialis]